VIAVGANVESIVGEEGKDVLLEVYAPWCAHCKVTLLILFSFSLFMYLCIAEITPDL
jgi:thiol:disulfide interchange protein